MRFTRGSPKCGINDVYLNQQKIEWVKYTKYLGVTIDCNLHWNKHFESIIKRAKRGFFTARSMVGKVWGLSPKLVMWLWKQIILPRITYGCIVWWHKAQQVTVANKLNSLQRLALLLIS